MMMMRQVRPSALYTLPLIMLPLVAATILTCTVSLCSGTEEFVHGPGVHDATYVVQRATSVQGISFVFADGHKVRSVHF